MEQKNTPGLNNRWRCFICQHQRCIPDVKLTFQQFAGAIGGTAPHPHGTKMILYYYELFATTLSAITVRSASQRI